MLPAALSLGVTHAYCVQCCGWVTFSKMGQNEAMLKTFISLVMDCLKVVKYFVCSSGEKLFAGEEQHTYAHQVIMICSFTVCVGVC